MTSEPRAHANQQGAAGDPIEGRLLDGRYRVGARIARGGMASVHEATDLRLDRTVAVKVMHPGLGGDDDFADRFVREARAAARLNHPHVVGVFDQGDDAGSVFLVMELVPGHTLRDVVRKEAPMSPSRALALLDPVLSALAHAHRAGLIHRDIKPENVLIADDGRVKVADFGLAKAVSADTQHTATGGVLIGTVSYLAPELVVDGRSDARADVYAAGVVLYELLTGQKPHEGESPIQVAYKHVHEDVPAPSTLVPGLPDYVDALVARATARDRDQRPADAGVLLHQVHRVAQALAAGDLEDPELAADLWPRTPVSDDTEPDPFDAEEFATLLTPAQAVATHAASSGHSHRAHRDHRPRRGRPPGRRATPAGTPARQRRWRGPLVMLLALLLAVGLGVGAWWFGWARWTQTPSVLGQQESAAVAKLDRAGLEAEIGDPAYSESVPEGEVLRTDPAPGERVLDGGTVTVVLSLGQERYEVPKLRGLTEDEAQDAVAARNLEFGESTGRWSDTVETGTVMASDPGRGTSLKPGTVVDIVLSKGPKPVTLRDWTGKDAEKAQAWFDQRGIEVTLGDPAYSDTVAEGDVVSQDPGQRHALPRRRGHARRQPGPRAGRGPGRADRLGRRERAGGAGGPRLRGQDRERAGVHRARLRLPGRPVVRFDGAGRVHDHAVPDLTTEMT